MQPSINQEKEKTISLLKAWMSAIRVRSLPIPTIQVIAGTALAYAHLGFIDWGICFFGWLVAVAITFGTNLINDVYDHEKGGDLPDRAGHKKVITAGFISKQTLFIAGMAAFTIAVLCSIPLAFDVGWGIIFLTALCCLIGYGYTGGPYPISYLGLSEVFILFFYGFVLVGAAYSLQTGDFSGRLFVCALQMGLLAILPNAINNFRDKVDDAKVDKLTLAVRFGDSFARKEIIICVSLPFLLNIYWLMTGYQEAGFLSMLLIPLAYYIIHGLRKIEPGPMVNLYFPLSVLLHFGFGLLLSIGFVLHA